MVLIGAGMPSVLAEVAFLTNRPEAALVKTPAYRQRVAEALHAAVHALPPVAQAPVVGGSGR